MEKLLMIFITALCVSLGIRVFQTPGQAMVFTRSMLPLKDVKKYNYWCGGLIIGFGIVADAIILLFLSLGELWSYFLPIGIIAEAVLLMFLYSRVEKSMIRK